MPMGSGGGEEKGYRSQPTISYRYQIVIVDICICGVLAIPGWVGGWQNDHLKYLALPLTAMSSVTNS